MSARSRSLLYSHCGESGMNCEQNEQKSKYTGTENNKALFSMALLPYLTYLLTH
jgi:hypothetical protein